MPMPRLSTSKMALASNRSASGGTKYYREDTALASQELVCHTNLNREAITYAIRALP